MIAWLCWTSLAGAQEVSGFVEARLQGYLGVDAEIPLTAVERFRPTLSAELGDRWVMSTTIEAGLSQGWRTAQVLGDLAEDNGIALPADSGLALPEYDNDFFAISSAGDYLGVDRLFVEGHLPFADVRIGRQAANWGSGFVVNPSDPFPEVLLTEPWRPRSGLNAVRVDVPFGELNSVQLIAAADDAFLHPRLAGRVTVNALQTDWSLVGAWREEVDEAIVGLDIKGTLGVGFWFEGVVHLPESGEPFEELAVGLDYSFPVLEQLVVTAQYYRNGSGTTGSQPLSIVQERQPFAPVFGGRDYLMGSVSAGITRDLSSSILWVQNLNDLTAFVVPNISLAAAGSIDISLAGQIPVDLGGTGGEFKPAADQLVLDLPTSNGGVTTVDLGGLVPDATLILWSRLNF